MAEEKKGFDIPSFVEDKGEIDLNLFRLDDEEEEVKEVYVPAHGQKKAPVQAEAPAAKAEPVEEAKVVMTRPVKEEAPKEEIPEEPEEEEEPPVRGRRRLRTSLLAIILALIILILLILGATLIIGRLSGGDQPAPTPAPTAEPTPAPTPTPTPTPTPEATATPEPTPTPEATATSEPTAEPTPTPTSEPAPTSAPVQGTAYKLTGTMNVRTGPGLNYAKVDPANIPAAYQSAAAGSAIRLGTVIDVLEIKEDGYSYWGRIGTDAWVCLEDEAQAYAEKQ
ncbi:MAG: hypothetical protein IKE21_06365 [Erysipelotrichaceae bacterium]|nr:hypothetical protein [Erysipelotrichaceae bacterium]